MRLFAALALLALVAPAVAAERSISIVTDEKDEVRMVALAQEANRATCENFQLPPTCTVPEIVARHGQRPDPFPVIYKDGWDYFVKVLAQPALDGAFNRVKSQEELLQARAYQKLTPEQRASFASPTGRSIPEKALGQ